MTDSEPLYEDGDFRRLFWRTFSPKRAANIILDPDELFYGLKDVLLAALLAWSIDPRNSRFRQQVTMAAVASKLIAAEKWASKASQNGVGRDLKARYARLGPRFISEVYYGVGGMKAVYNGDSSQAISRQLALSRRQVINVVEVMRIFHFVHEKRPSRCKGSLERARSVINKVWKHHPGCYRQRGFEPYQERELKDAWSDREVSVAYLYAAAHTKMSQEQSLLEHLLSGQLRASAEAEWVKQWLAHSAYAVTLLSENYSKEAFKRGSQATPTCAAIAITETGLSPTEDGVICGVFSIG